MWPRAPRPLKCPPELRSSRTGECIYRWIQWPSPKLRRTALACPFFMPVQKLDGAWLHPSRLPLGAGWDGHCSAPGHEGTRPSDQELHEFCNWDTPRSVRVCRSNAIAMRYASRLPATKVPGCSCGLCARPAIVPQTTARWNTTWSGSSGFHRTPTRVSRRWWSVTFRPTCSVEFNPPRRLRTERKFMTKQRRSRIAPARPRFAVRDG